MEIISNEKIHKDHIYYRTGSEIYRKYLHECGLKTVSVGGPQFCWIKDIFGLFHMSKYERIDIEPDIDLLKKNGFKHGMVIWVPYTKTSIPAGWRKMLVNCYFTTTGYSVLENENYFQKWSTRAKRARKTFLNNTGVEIKILNNADFNKIYAELDISQPYKKDFVKYHSKLSKYDDNNIKNLVCFFEGKPIAGLSVVNYDKNSSAHLVAFITETGKQKQAGTGLIDYWFKMSLENGIKYINFDHLKDKYMTKDQQGYTTFKENFMDYKVVFSKAYFKII